MAHAFSTEWSLSAGRQREAFGEYRTAVRVIARLDVTAVQARVLQGDRQAKAASLGTRPGRVGFVEPAGKRVVLLGDLNGTMGGRAFAGITAQQLRGRRINKWREFANCY